jgi:capsular polysaccharide biosynthesis protein
MAHYFDAYQYLQHVFSRFRFILVTVVTALLLAIIVSNLQPRIYTATSRVLIEPPAGSDPRASMAVSPVYLELLRTYELFASSDDLFARAAKKFDLSRNGSIERLKRSVLKVEVPRNTKILEIKARLRDPRTAQAMALYIAEETVRLNRGTNVEGDQELTASLEKQLVEAHSRVDNANLAWRQMSLREPVEGLRVQIESATALRSRLQQEVLAAQLNITDGEDR